MDEERFIALCESCMASFYRMAYSIVGNQQDAEDAVQQALMNAWRFRERAQDGVERAYIMRILINACRDILRKRKRCIPLAEVPETAAQPSAGEDGEVFRAIQALPAGLRIPFLLKYMEGMTEKEIAGAMKLPQSSVKSRLFRARNRLKQELKGGRKDESL